MIEWRSVGMIECLSGDTIQYNTLQYITLLVIQYIRVLCNTVHMDTISSGLELGKLIPVHA